MTGPSPPHILLIDDRPDAVGAPIAAMRARGWRVSVATDGAQGCRRAELLAPDVILLDVRMPHMDGFAVCRRLREHPRTQHTPVLFLTTADTPEERLEGLSNGAVDYVMKTCAPAELLARIQIHLELARRAAQPASGTVPALPADEVTLRAAQRLIGEELAALPPLARLAERVGTSERRLSEIFRRRLGTTVFAWVREARLREARRLLADTSMDVQEIARAVGFRGAGNFTTAFRERHGLTPSRYREEWRAGRVPPGADCDAD
jgi:DNA-binding response OmpR family regulator